MDPVFTVVLPPKEAACGQVEVVPVQVESPKQAKHARIRLQGQVSANRQDFTFTLSLAEKGPQLSVERRMVLEVKWSVFSTGLAED